MKNYFIELAGRRVGPDYLPLIIAEIGINHEGKIEKAINMIDDAHKRDCECVKFQTHVIEDEMIPNKVVPGNSKETIWEIMKRCSLTKEENIYLKKYVESKNMIYLTTPFSRAAANEANDMKVKFFKIGSGECNNYPLIEHIAKFGKPVILSTGMNDIFSIKPAVEILRKYNIPYALLHCTSIYPTPPQLVRLGALKILKENFNDAIIGFSDHSLGNYACFGAVALGANIIEKHFTSDNTWPGPDISISISPIELEELIIGSNIIHKSLDSSKDILIEEKSTIDFAYASVVTIQPISKGENFTKKNIWVKRPGTGEIKAIEYKKIIGKKTNKNLPNNYQLKISDIEK